MGNLGNVWKRTCAFMIVVMFEGDRVLNDRTVSAINENLTNEVRVKITRHSVIRHSVLPDTATRRDNYNYVLREKGAK